MLILGILAAIALPAFFNQKDKAGDAKAKEYAHSAQVAVETYATDHSGSYVGATAAELKAIEPTLNSAKDLEVLGAAGTGLPVANGYQVRVKGTSGWFGIANTAGTVTYPCQNPGTGGCPSGTPANWGG